MANKTPLYQQHIDDGGKMVDFSGWDMPINYGSQIEEHHQVRKDAGMFDVSHMTVVDIKGARCKAFLQYLLANDVAKLKTPGKALYTCMLNENGGVIDDLIVYYRADDDYRLVVNAATREKDLAWMGEQAKAFGVDVIERPELAMIAIQGPQARERCGTVFNEAKQQAVADIKPFQGVLVDDWWIARTGYTGEDGYEIILPGEHAVAFWQALEKAGVKPCGLGARDTLRLEAGLNLYGSDMDESISPLTANLAWTIAWEPNDRDFIGRKALEAQQQQGVEHRMVGLVLDERGVLRNHLVVRTAQGQGEITSGSFSPTIGKSIALARIPVGDATEAEVEMRGKWFPVRIVKPSFVRNGKILID